jgi:three-Cys-motif partner protein
VATRRRATSKGKAHRFGGDWTSTKLDVLEKYLSSYTKVLKNQPFRIAYIDAFAGTGYRTLRYDEDAHSTELLFPDLATPGPQDLLDGSARLALKIEPRFDRYIFIERSPERCRQLENLRQEFPDLSASIRIEQGEANQEIRKLCEKNWRSRRAVLFLDPYGMQVEWETIAAIAATEAIDLWVLFPLGIGVNRLLTRTGKIPPEWRARLDALLGTQDWYDEFYRVETSPTLFGGEEERVVKATVETIGRYFNDRLRTVFAGVADEPAVLRNSTSCPLYLFCFAAGNAKGAPIALKIANHLLKGVR